ADLLHGHHDVPEGAATRCSVPGGGGNGEAGAATEGRPSCVRRAGRPDFHQRPAGGDEPGVRRSGPAVCGESVDGGDAEVGPGSAVHGGGPGDEGTAGCWRASCSILHEPGAANDARTEVENGTTERNGHG